MRVILALLSCCVLLGGCASPAPPKAASACPTALSAWPTTPGNLVRVYVGNDGGKDSCVDVRLDGQLFFSGNVPTSPPTLHADPSPRGDAHTQNQTMTVTVDETANGMSATKTFPVGAENHVVIDVAHGGISIQVLDHAPQYA
jgi:hypothetical protein